LCGHPHSQADCYEILTQQLEATREVQKFTEKLEDIIQKAAYETMGNDIKAKQKQRGKTVAWWTNELTILRKKTNARRRRYQRTTDNETLRESRK
jgi:phenylalanyl-tRNA synthetase alpha subunit